MRGLWLLVAAACSGSGTPAHPPHPPHPAPIDAQVQAPASPAHPTEAECQALISHAVDLAAAEAGAKPSPDEAGSAAQPLRTFATECATLSRDAYRCGMAAETLAAFTTCSGHAQ